MTKSILDEMNDFMDGNIFVAPVSTPAPVATEKKETKNEKRQSQVGNTFITIGSSDVAGKAKARAAAGKQKPDEKSGESDDAADDTDDE